MLQTLLALTVACLLAGPALADEPSPQLSLVAVGAVSTILSPQSACIDRREFDAFAFHSAGEGIVETATGTCAKIARLRGLPEMPFAIQTISAAELEEMSARHGPHFTLSNTDKGSGPVVLAEIRTRRGYPNGDWWCPPDTDWETDICLGASLVIAPGKVRHWLGATPDADPAYSRSRFKFIGGHAVRYVEGGHWIAIIEQTGEDYWYIQWQTPVKHGRFCLPANVIEHFGVTSDLASTPGENSGLCYSLREAKRR